MPKNEHLPITRVWYRPTRKSALWSIPRHCKAKQGKPKQDRQGNFRKGKRKGREREGEGGTGTRSNRGREDNFKRITKFCLQREGEGGRVNPMHWTKRITQNIRGETRAFIRARLAPAQTLNLSALMRSGALK
jgi:hypothetical protein